MKKIYSVILSGLFIISCNDPMTVQEWRDEAKLSSQEEYAGSSVQSSARSSSELSSSSEQQLSSITSSSAKMSSSVAVSSVVASSSVKASSAIAPSSAKVSSSSKPAISSSSIVSLSSVTPSSSIALSSSMALSSSSGLIVAASSNYYGRIHKHFNQAWLTSQYTEWLSKFKVESGIQARIKAEPTGGLNEQFTTSNSQALGMLLAAMNRDSVTMRKLWNYTVAFSSNGLMNWQIDGFANVKNAGSDTHADIMMAVALMLASSNCQASYSVEADKMLDKILVNDIELGTSRPKPGTNYTQPTAASSLMPGIYRVFSDWNTSKATDWKNVAQKSYSILTANRNANTGLFSDQMNNDGTIYNSTQFSYGAAASILGAALDYYWYGTTSAVTLLQNNATWAAQATPTKISGPIPLAGPIPGNLYDSDFYTSALMLNFMVHQNDVVFEKYESAVDWSDALTDSYVSALEILFGATAGGLFEKPAP